MVSYPFRLQSDVLRGIWAGEREVYVGPVEHAARFGLALSTFPTDRGRLNSFII